MGLHKTDMDYRKGSSAVNTKETNSQYDESPAEIAASSEGDNQPNTTLADILGSHSGEDAGSTSQKEPGSLDVSSEEDAQIEAAEPEPKPVPPKRQAPPPRRNAPAPSFSTESEPESKVSTAPPPRRAPQSKAPPSKAPQSKAPPASRRAPPKPVKKLEVNEDEGSDIEDLPSPPPPKTTSAPPPRSRAPPSTAAKQTQTLATAAERTERIMLPAFKATLEKLDIMAALKHLGLEPNEYLQMVMDYKEPETVKGVASKCKFSLDLLEAIVLGKHDHRFPDTLAKRVCLSHCAHSPPAGREPYSCCAAPIENGRVCKKCLTKAAAKKLNEDASKTGWTYAEYRKKCLADASAWAAKKVAELKKLPPGTVTVKEMEEIDEGIDDEDISEEHGLEKYTGTLKNAMVHPETGAVLVKSPEGIWVCYGMDPNGTNRRAAVSKTMKARLEGLGFTVNPDHVSKR